MIAALFIALVATPSADIVIGEWKTPVRNGIVKIQRCGSSICGTLVTSDGLRANPDLKDLNNRNDALKGRPLKGLEMLKGFSWSGGQWDGGTIYNAEDGRTYQARITPVDGNTLKLRGCVFVPLCKTQSWTRVH